MAYKFYGFEYWGGPHTTTGDYPNIQVAGDAYSFDSKRERDAWVNEYPHIDGIGRVRGRIKLFSSMARQKKYGAPAKAEEEI